MPQAWPGVVAAWNWLWSASGFWANAARIVVTSAISYGLGQLLQRKTTLGSGLTQGSPLDMRIDSLAPHRIIYGKSEVGPVLRFRHATGDSNEYAYLILVWAAHECEEFVAFKVDGEIVEFTEEGIASNDYGAWLRVTHHLGAYDQAADANFLAELDGLWTENDRWQGRCYSAVRMRWNTSKWPTGMPRFTAVIKGRKIYDFRDETQDIDDYSTWKWSDNPSLCIADYLRGVPMLDGAGALVKPYGTACDNADVPASRFIAEANHCDELVPIAAGGYEKRYTCNGCFDTDAQPPDVLDALAVSMAGKIVPVGSTYLPYAGVWRSPEFTVDETMLRGEPTASNPLPRAQRLNVVKGTFRNPDTNSEPDDFEPIVSDALITEDGGELSRDLDLAFTNSNSMAQRIAKIFLLRSRQGLVTEWPCNLRAIPVLTGGNVEINSTEFDWEEKAFEVMEFDLSMERGDDGGTGFATKVLFQETDPSIFDWNTDEEDTRDPAPNTGRYDPRIVFAPTGLTLAVATVAERTALPRIKASWDLPLNAWITSGGYSELGYKKSTDDDWTTWPQVPGDISFDFISDLAPGATYNVRLRHINQLGTIGPWCVPQNIVAVAGLGTYTALLTNESHTVSCTADGTPIADELGADGRAKTAVLAFAGASALTAVSDSPGPGQFAFTIATLSGTGTYTKESDSNARIDEIDSDTLVARITIDLEGVLTITKDWTIAKVTSGNDGDPGTNGDDARIYWLLPDAAAINKSQAGAFTPATLNLSSLTRLGHGAAAAYDGRFTIEVFNGSSWTNVYTSSADESSRAYTVVGTILAIRCRLYLAGGTSTLLDEQIVPITFDGAQGPPGADGAPGAPGADGSSGPAGSASQVGTTHITDTTTHTILSLTLNTGARPVFVSASFDVTIYTYDNEQIAATLKVNGVAIAGDAQITNGTLHMQLSGQGMAPSGSYNVTLEVSGYDYPASVGGDYEVSNANLLVV